MNPFYCYICSFSIAMLSYSLGWSSVYPTLSLALVVFLLATMAVHLFAGQRWEEKKGHWKIMIGEDRNPVKITLFIYACWSLDFLYEGGIPIVKILLGQPYDYRLFGFPSVHVFTVTFASFYTVYLFHHYLSGRKKIILLLYCINLAAALLIYSRAMLFFNISSSVILYIFLSERIKKRYLVMLPFAALLFFYFFGVLGTLRVSRESHAFYDNSLFLETGQATEKFRESWIPAEYFWTYIYLSSPIANLQANINRAHRQPFTTANVAKLVTNEFLFDFLSKRINKLLGISPVGEHTIPGPFNVSTLYSQSFSHLGWIGMGILALFAIGLPWFYLTILPSPSPFFLSGMAILSTMYLFMAYDNTIRFTGLGFQLVYPLFFSVLDKKKIFSLTKGV